ncbi:MAG: hypothetical protein ACT4PV_00425 [Planctomycetaceae bacterium]
MRALPCLLAVPLIAACALSPEHGPRVDVSAAPGEGGLLVRFRRTEPGVIENLARLEASGGTLEGTLHSADRLTAAVRWRGPKGTLRCAFAYGGVGIWPADAAVDTATLDYVFLECPWARISSKVPRGCAIVAGLDLLLEVDEAQLPARLELPDASTLDVTARPQRLRLELLQSTPGVLAAGEWRLLLRGAGGEEALFVIGVDPDGAPAAVTGYLRNW